MKNSDKQKISVVILAAGKGTRMNSDLPKVLHPVAGRPMLQHAIAAAQKLDPEQVLVVVGYGAEQVKKNIADEVEYVLQEPQLGTGHAAQLAIKEVAADIDEIIVSYGDMPLLTGQIFQQLSAARHKQQAAAVVLTTTMDPPGSFGRIVRDEDNALLAIVEDKDCSVEQKKITEVNVAVYCFNRAALQRALGDLHNDNAQGEYYLTDVIEIMREAGERVAAMRSDDVDSCLGVNDLDDLARAEAVMRARPVS